MQRSPTAARIATTMDHLVRQLDPTRLCTAAMNSWSSNTPDGISAGIDVQGFNYFHSGDMDRFHSANPAMPAIGTEEASAYYTRGIYEATPHYRTAYDTNQPGYGATAEQWWRSYSARPWASGAFVWTGFDYRGEPSPFRWPNINSEFGILDTCGFPKDVFYYYQSWWTDKTVLHLMPHWNWPGKEGQDIDVRCFSNCEEVELLLNGQASAASPCRKTPTSAGLFRTLPAPSWPAASRAAASSPTTGGNHRPARRRPAFRRPRRAAGRRRRPRHCHGKILDSQRRPVPVADNLVHFDLSGPGAILGVGNGDPVSHEPDVFLPAAGQPSSAGWQRHLFNGLAQVIVQSAKNPGQIQLAARSDGLEPATLEISAQPSTTRPAVP